MPSPASARFVTWKVDGTMRSPSASMFGTKRFRPNGLRAGRATGRGFLYSNQCNQDCAIRNNLQERNHREKRPQNTLRACNHDGPLEDSARAASPVAKRRGIPQRSSSPHDNGLYLTKAGRIILAVSAE